MSLAAEFKSAFGRTHPERDAAEMCKYCYNEDTQRITDPIDLAPYAKHYEGREFKAFSCFCCGAKFHFEVNA